MKSFPRRFVTLSFLFTFLLLFSSCAEFHVQVPMTNNPDTASATPGSNYSGTVTTWSFFWGIITDGGVQTSNCTECGIQDVKISRDFFQQVLSIISLGIASPMNVSWMCGAAPAREGSLSSLPDSGKNPVRKKLEDEF